MRLEIFYPYTNEKGTVIGKNLCLYGVPYCTTSNTLGTISYNYVSERKVRGTILNRTASERTDNVTNVSENSGIWQYDNELGDISEYVI